jgi:hypothetical protein
MSGYPLPGDVYTSVCLGWMQYYDSHNNMCYWRQIVSYIAQHTLPLGRDSVEDLYHISNLDSHAICTLAGLISDDWIHYNACQQLAQAWVLVLIDNRDDKQEEGGLYYYYNTITKESSWAEPGLLIQNMDDGGFSSFQDMLRSWDSWRLCCMENSHTQLFWYDMDTGQSVWA